MAKRHGNRVNDFESLFLRLEELVLANSGEDEFEEVFKLVVAKLWDERGPSGGRFRVYDTPAETHRAVVALLREADKAWPGILEPGDAPALAPDHLHVCVGALARHSISDAGLAVMDGFFEFLVAKAAKGAKGQYFTPRHVVEFCVRMLRPRADETVLDPACGSGGFLIHVLNFVRSGGGLDTPAAVREYCAARLWGFDIDARAVRVAKALMVLAGDGAANVVRLNSLLKPAAAGELPFDDAGAAPTLTAEDVCRARMRRHKGFDLILTNPPFAGEVREDEVLRSYALSRGRPRVERDVLFLERCVGLLRPGGRAAIVLPDNKFAAAAWGYAREWLLREARVLAVVSLGRETFLPHTHQKAGVLFVRKYLPGETARAGQKVFFGISERSGKNSKGQLVARPGDGPPAGRVEHDLGDVAGALPEFCHRETNPLGF